MTSVGIDTVRLRIADVLEGIANAPGWPQDLWEQFQQLIKSTEVDGLLAYADEEFIHYSGEYNSRNILLIRAKPDQIQVRQYKEEFLNIAVALRNGTSWTDYKRQNGISEGSETPSALLIWLKKLFGR